ncbi:unnamed protein product, partial [Trichobilharzia regenti]
NLVLQNAEERWEAIGYPGHLYGTVNGGLGLIVQVSPVLFAFLKEIEFRLTNLVVPVGGFSHDVWRAFKADREVKMAHNFVDGDLIETVTDLKMEDKVKLVKGLRIPVCIKRTDYPFSSYALYCVTVLIRKIYLLSLLFYSLHSQWDILLQARIL